MSDSPPDSAARFQGYQAGDWNRQINVIGDVTVTGGAPSADVGTEAEFRTDVVALLRSLDVSARHEHLPPYLRAGADVTKMARTVRLLGRVRRGQVRVAGRDARKVGLGGPRLAERQDDLMYALPSEQDDRADEAPRAWEQVVSDYDRLVVLGDPGMGKSWLVRTETSRLARRALSVLSAPGASLEGVAIPIPVRADVLAERAVEVAAGLPEVVTSHLVGQGLLPTRSAVLFARLISSGDVILLVDALDEVPQVSPDRATRAPRKVLDDLLREWVSRCSGTARGVVTTRLAGYSGSPLPKAHEVELLPFTIADVRTAMFAWQLPASAAARVDAHLDSPGVADLVRIPLLLALLCSLAADLPDQQPLPTTRTDLYREVTWRFLSGIHRTIDPGGHRAAASPAERAHLLRILGALALAFATTPSGWVDRMRHDEVLLHIAAQDPDAIAGPPTAVLEAITERAGVLVPAGNPDQQEQSLMFLHRTFAEYLVADQLRETPPERRNLIIRNHQWFDPAWAEVIPMLGGLLASDSGTMTDAVDLVQHFLTPRTDPLRRSFRTALRILGETPAPDDLLTAHQQRALAQGTRILLADPTLAPHAGRVLARMRNWPSRFVPLLRESLTDYRYHVRRAAVTALASRPEADIMDALLARLYDPARPVRDELVRAMAAHTDPPIVDAFKTGAYHFNIGIRVTALEGLLGRDDHYVAEALLAPVERENLTSEAHWSRRIYRHPSTAVDTYAALISAEQPSASAYGRGQLPPNARFLDLLLSLGESHAYGETLSRFASLDDPQLQRALISHLTAESPRIRAAIIRVLAQQHNPDHLPMLVKHINDPDQQVRTTTVQALTSYPDNQVPTNVRTRLPAADASYRLGSDGTGSESEAPTSPDRSQPGTPTGPTTKRSQRSDDQRTLDDLLEAAKSRNRKHRIEALTALTRSDDPRAFNALLNQLRYRVRRPGYRYRTPQIPQAVVDELAVRNDPRVLATCCGPGIWMIFTECGLRRYDLAERIADRLYLSLSSRDQRRLVRRLGRVTRLRKTLRPLSWTV